MDAKKLANPPSGALLGALALVSTPVAAAQIVHTARMQQAADQLRERQAARTTDTFLDRLGDRFFFAGARMNADIEFQQMIGTRYLDPMSLAACNIGAFLFLRDDTNLLRPLFSGYGATKA